MSDAAATRELERVYDELKTLRSSIEGLREAIVGDHDKLRDKVQALELVVAQQGVQVATLQAESKENRLKAIIQSVAAAGVTGAGVVAAQHFMQ